VALAGAGVAEHHDGFPCLEIGAGGQVGEGGWGDRWDGGQVEVGEALEAGELGFGHAADPASLEPVVDLGGEDFGEVSQVGAAFPDRDLREPDGLGADGG